MHTLSSSEKILYAGPWVGEFGWELFCWQGHLRYLSTSYKKTVITCKKGHGCLYKDFAEVIELNIPPLDANMWNCHGFKFPSFRNIFGRELGPNKWIPPLSPIVRYDHMHKLDKESLFRMFSKQTFVKYGTLSKGYDILIHARSKTNLVNNNVKSSYRNWHKVNWQRLADEFKDKNIACIGTKYEAEHIIGDDLRGISLSELTNVLASSKVLVSPSSGPVHLAALCGCPHITWFGDPYEVENTIRFTTDWNPFGTKVDVVYDPKWNPTVKQLKPLIEQNLL